MVRSDVVDRFTEFGAVLGVFENFRPNIGEPQIARRTFEQANAELILKVGNAAADGRGWHLEAARRFRKTFRLDNLGENQERIEIRHVLPLLQVTGRSSNTRTAQLLNSYISEDYPKYGKYICSFSR